MIEPADYAGIEWLEESDKYWQPETVKKIFQMLDEADLLPSRSEP